MPELTLFVPQEKLDRWRRAAAKRNRNVTDWAFHQMQNAAIAATPEEDNRPVGEICGGRGIVHNFHPRENDES